MTKQQAAAAAAAATGKAGEGKDEDAVRNVVLCVFVVVFDVVRCRSEEEKWRGKSPRGTRERSRTFQKVFLLLLVAVLERQRHCAKRAARQKQMAFVGPYCQRKCTTLLREVAFLSIHKSTTTARGAYHGSLESFLEHFRKFSLAVADDKEQLCVGNAQS